MLGGLLGRILGDVIEFTSISFCTSSGLEGVVGGDGTISGGEVKSKECMSFVGEE